MPKPNLIYMKSAWAEQEIDTKKPNSPRVQTYRNIYMYFMNAKGFCSYSKDYQAFTV